MPIGPTMTRPQFYDVDYFEFIKDPVSRASRASTGTSASSSPTRPARRWTADHAESQKGPRAPKHTYSLADYGLTDEQVKERFKGL